MKIKLAILEHDINYLNRVVTAFNTRYSDSIEVYSFTEKEVALETLQNIKINVLLASDVFQIDVSKLPSYCGFAYLVDSVGVEVVKEQKAVCRFQKADLIYKQILSIYSENSTYIIKGKGDEGFSEKIWFTSIAGGVGASTMAASFAVFMAMQGKKVLYLNLENLGDSELFFNGTGQFNFDDIIYAIKSNKMNLGLKIESTVRQSDTGVYFFAPTQTALDQMELNNDDIKRLLEELDASGLFEYVVIDAAYEFDKRSAMLWKVSDRIVCVADGNEISNAKLERALQTWSIWEKEQDDFYLNKLKLIYNKFSNKTGRVLENIDLEKLGGIPKFEHATTSQIIHQIVGSSVFANLA